MTQMRSSELRKLVLRGKWHIQNVRVRYRERTANIRHVSRGLNRVQDEMKLNRQYEWCFSMALVGRLSGSHFSGRPIQSSACYSALRPFLRIAPNYDPYHCESTDHAVDARSSMRMTSSMTRTPSGIWPAISRSPMRDQRPDTRSTATLERCTSSRDKIREIQTRHI